MRVDLSIKEQNQSRSSEGGNFALELMHSRTWAHLAHLSLPKYPGSHATHEALKDYYEGIVDLIDRLVETAQGYYGELLEYPCDTAFVPPSTSAAGVSEDVILAYFKSLRDRIEQIYPQVPQPALQNIVAEISELVCGTLYKLRFLQ